MIARNFLFDKFEALPLNYFGFLKVIQFQTRTGNTLRNDV
ncbi:hypothetical protein VCHENC02_2528 [Vibrio harveyi]|uniref:Uncharacterized protein n=1 Tax=Vibrio harveyi TaxID=669 RepID=A0A454CZP3_VIBHA|nr:hypothetical protein VCHENC02_2528 [Vibrio harveyi]